MTDFNSRLARLHARLVDILNGYDTLSRRAEPDLMPHVETLVALHRDHHADLDQIMRETGQEPDEDGTYLTHVHRSVVVMRDVFDELDEDVLPQIVDGEERLLELYDETIEDAPQGAPARRILLDQQAELAEMVADLRRID